MPIGKASENNFPDPILVDRELTSDERKLAEWMLVNGIEHARTFLRDLNHARVYSSCPCGCASIDFVIEGHEVPTGGIGILGDFRFGQGDETSGVFIFERESRLAGIEVYSFGEQTHRVLPSPSELRPFEG